MKIQYLADRPEAIPVIAEWIYKEWSFFYPGKTPRYVQSLLRKRMNKKSLPITLVAFESGEPIGTISLKKSDMLRRKRLTPWVTSLYVSKPWRKKGIGSSLVKAIEQKAVSLKMHKLFLLTVDNARIVRFYEKSGWRIKEKVTHHAYGIIVMEKEI